MKKLIFVLLLSPLMAFGQYGVGFSNWVTFPNIVSIGDVDVGGTLYGSLVTKSYSFTSQGVGAGTYFVAGYYDAPAADANLDQAGATVTHGTANGSYAAHGFIVAAAAGTVDAGVIGLKVTGTRIEDDGTRTASYIDVLSADITTLSTNEYLEAVKFIGQVTFELYTVSGSPVNYSLDFNYGFVKYEDFGSQKFDVQGFEIVGLAGATDASFNITLIHHDATSWTYSAAGFDPTLGHVIVDLQTVHNTEYSLINGHPFAFKRVPITHGDISGNVSEGVIVRIVTNQNNSVQSCDIHIGCKFVR